VTRQTRILLYYYYYYYHNHHHQLSTLCRVYTLTYTKQYMVNVTSFSMTNFSYFYTSTFRRLCAVSNMAADCSSLMSYFPGMRMLRWFKRMLKWFPRLQVATACFSCSPPNLNLLDPYFKCMYIHNNNCHRVTAHLQLNILLLLLCSGCIFWMIFRWFQLLLLLLVFYIIITIINLEYLYFPFTT